MISNSGSNEFGGITGGYEGDQTGREWWIIPWYNRPWTCILRHPNPQVREKLAQLSEQSARNDNIGYDQNRRYNYWYQLQKNNYNPSAIRVKCSADCSAGVIANTKAVGFLLGIDSLKNISATYTGNMRGFYSNAGFQVLTDSKYLTSDKYLLRGDILLNDVHHVAVNLTNGIYSGQTQQVVKNVVTDKTMSRVPKWIGACTGSEVYVRTDAGQQYPTVTDYDHLNRGDTFKVCDSKKGTDGYTWYFMIIADRVEGFMRGDYVKKIADITPPVPQNNSQPKPQPQKPQKPRVQPKEEVIRCKQLANKKDVSLKGIYEVTATDLNLRAETNTNSRIIKVLPRGTKVTNYGFYADNQGYRWLYVAYGDYRGFVASMYTRKI